MCVSLIKPPKCLSLRYFPILLFVSVLMSDVELLNFDDQEMKIFPATSFVSVCSAGMRSSINEVRNLFVLPVIFNSDVIGLSDRHSEASFPYE